MNDIKSAKFFQEFVDTADNMYRLGWDERNGGNISLMVEPEDAEAVIGDSKPIRTIPTGFEAKPLEGKYFLVTGTGQYFKNVKKDPENTVGLLRLVDGGTNAELYWGYEDGGKFTSEFPSHMMSHMKRLEVDPDNRAVIHCHPTNLLAMTYVLPLEDKAFSRTLWQMSTECIVVFPEGVGVLPWMLCGTNEIGEATAAKMADYRLVVWAMHGIYGAGKDLDETFGLIETVEKASQIYMLTSACKRINTIEDSQLKELAEYFGVDYRKEFLGE